ncbi:MAG: hypothetical protein ABI553_11255 [Chloroflexota bacterium]
MIRRQRARDPFWDDGAGARHAQRRRRVEGALAFTIAVAACGLTAAMWLKMLAPFADRLGLG